MSSSRRTRERSGRQNQNVTNNDYDSSSSTSAFAHPSSNILPVQDLHRAFADIQKKFSHLLQQIDEKENVGMFVEAFGAVTIGLQNLREIAAAIIEEDPHFACLNRVFEDLWLVGFTRPLKLCNRLENCSRCNETAISLPAWRYGFLFDWQGYLTTLRDTIHQYREPRTGWQFLSTMKLLLPPAYSTKAGQRNPINQLPLNYLLRDIALCLARTYHANPELAKVWKKRAIEINGLLGPVPYEEAWKRLKSADQQEEPRTRPLQEAVRILGRTEGFFLSPGDNEWEIVSDEDKQCVAEVKEQVREEAKGKDKVESNDYGVVMASQRDLQTMKVFRQRNAFIRGLLQAAEEQGSLAYRAAASGRLSKEVESDSPEERESG